MPRFDGEVFRFGTAMELLTHRSKAPYSLAKGPYASGRNPESRVPIHK
jgi:hypothetical protein